MPMNTVIQERRRLLGLTQEQVAEVLGVTTPAVSKWEKGITCPDIGLLPPLARLLRIDLNTLFCFQEELTNQEIAEFCKTLQATAGEVGISAAFCQAEDLLRRYPHNEMLLQTVALNLDGMLMFSALPGEERTPLEEKAEGWYQHLAESADVGIRNMANYMLASRYIQLGQLEKAQETLDIMPDRHDLMADYADKLMLQVNIYMKQGRPEQAARELEQALLTAANKIQLLLLRLTDAELAAGEREKAEYAARTCQNMVPLLGLWEITAYLAPLSLAVECKDREKILPLLRGMLNAAVQPWDVTASALYHRLQANSTRTLDQGIVTGMLTELSQDPQYDFLRDDERFQAILEDIRKILALDVPSIKTE